MSISDRFRKLQLTQLNQIEVASPCSVDWDEMEGDEKVRFCSQCQLHVFNLSAMDVEEAGTRVAEHADDLCVRFYRRADGTMLTRDCPEGVERKRKARRDRLQATATFTFGALVTGAMLTPLQGAILRPAAIRISMHSEIKSGRSQSLSAWLDRIHDPEAARTDGTTLLMLAARVGNVEAARILLTHGANVHARDHQGRTPLAIALAEKQWKVATLLKESGGTR
jgi:hypothetical protein